MNWQLRELTGPCCSIKRTIQTGKANKMDIKQDTIAAIGNTPLIRLRKAFALTGCEILGKAEFMNPGQSVKDRAACLSSATPLHGEN